jgi:hypothetical protein
MPADEALLKPGEQDRQDFQKRIQAYSDSVEAWVGSTCEASDEQRARLKEIFSAQVASAIEAFGKGQDPNQRNKPFPKTFVLLFTRKDGIAVEFSDDVFKALRKRYLDAGADRETGCSPWRSDRPFSGMPISFSGVDD